MRDVILPLKAMLGWSDIEVSEYDEVSVYLGDTLIARLPMTTDLSRAGHGDDGAYFESEEQRMVEETVAPFLRRIFEVTP